MPAKKRTVEVVLVRWFDSAIYKGDPCQPEELSGYLENESAGLLVAENDDWITLALDRCLDTGDVRLTLCIPRTNIRAIRRWKVKA